MARAFCNGTSEPQPWQRTIGGRAAVSVTAYSLLGTDAGQRTSGRREAPVPLRPLPRVGSTGAVLTSVVLSSGAPDMPHLGVGRARHREKELPSHHDVAPMSCPRCVIDVSECGALIDTQHAPALDGGIGEP